MPERSPYEQGLTEEQVMEVAPVLSELVATAGWRALIALITGDRVTARERALAGDEADIKKWKGYIEGLTVVENIPHFILDRAMEISARQERQGKLSTYRGRLDNGGDLT